MIFQTVVIIVYCSHENFGPRTYLKRKWGPLLEKVERLWNLKCHSSESKGWHSKFIPYLVCIEYCWGHSKAL